MPTPARPRCLAVVTLSALLSLAAGCSSPPEPERAPPPAATTEVKPIMEGKETFAGGKIIARVTLALPVNFHYGKDANPTGGGSSRYGTGGGRRHPGDQGGADLPHNENATADDGPHLMGSTLPPAQLKIFLQNTSATEAVNCEITDFKSYLGDFAVFPGRYQIEAGQSAESEAMTSRLGVEGDAIPVTVALRIGDRTESKVVTLREINPPADAAK